MHNISVVNKDQKKQLHESGGGKYLIIIYMNNQNGNVFYNSRHFTCNCLR